MKHLRHLVLVVMFFLGVVTQSYAQTAKFEGLYILNFSRNVGWTGTPDDESFYIYVVNYDDLFKALQQQTVGKKIGLRPYKIVGVDTVKDIKGDPEMIIVGTASAGQLSQCTSLFKHSFIVSMKSNQCWDGGACVSFVSENGKLTYDISEKNITRQGLTVTQKLYQLGNVK